MTEWFYNWLWTQQDYLWFVAGIAWLSAGIWWWQERRRETVPGWIAWSAAAGVATSVIQIAAMSTYVPPEMYRTGSITSDLALGFTLAVQAAGWWAAGLRGQPGRGVLVTLIAVLLGLAAMWRYRSPYEGVIFISIAQLGAVAWWIFVRQPAEPRWRAAVLVTAMAPLLGTIGVLAEALGKELRHNDTSSIGPWAALAQTGAAVAVYLTARRVCAGDVIVREDCRTERWFNVGSVAWVLLGLGIAITAGTRGRLDFERSALGRVRAIAALMPTENVARLLDENFALGELRWHEFPQGGKIPVAYSPHAEMHAGPVIDELAPIARANPDVPWIAVVTLKDGWLVDAAFAITLPENRGDLTLIRRATLEDDLGWAEKRAMVSGPVRLISGETVFARAPLLEKSSSRMLGWLDFSFSVSQWVAAQVQPRALAYLVVALGLVIGRQLVQHRHRVRERDRATQEALVAAQASRLKTTFLANVSHELRTPLQTIMGYTDLLLPQAGTKDRDRLRAIREHADLMGRLVNDLIDLSAAESGQFQIIERPVALTDHVLQTAESLRPRAEAKGLAFVIEVARELPSWFLADPQRVRQVVLNLVGNAVKYTDRGRVQVSLLQAGREAEWVEVELRVQDTGPGIKPEEQSGLFAAFHRLNLTVEREGTGLGLAIVAAVCRAFRGSVRVESDGRTGSCFIARWRLAVSPAPAPMATGEIPLRGRKILVADDNALVRDLFVAFLTECGAVCATAADGEEAIRRLRGEDFDAVVLDLAMPRLDGISAVRRLRSEFPERRWRIVGVSAHASGTEHQEALAAGMDAFLVKPVPMADLARALVPDVSWVPPVRQLDRMRAHFEQRFRADARTQHDAVAEAWSRGEWNDIRAAAHYLHNSADIVGDAALARACSDLEAAARARDQDAGAEALRSCRLAMVPWVGEPADN